MDFSKWQFDHTPWYGWSVSAILHLCLVILFALLLMPNGDGRQEILEIEVTLEDTGAELIELEPITTSFDEFEEEPSSPIFQETEPLEIAHPMDLLASTAGSGNVGTASGHSRGGSGSAGQTSFFGTVANGDRFVYILDVSPSMDARNGKRRERAVLELLRSLDQLNGQQQFCVLVFGWQTRRMFDRLTSKMVPATYTNKRRLREWLAEMNTIPGTDPRKALHVSLAMKPSAVFFLSDGEFNKPKGSRFFADDDSEPEDVVQEFTPGEVPVHTVAFEDPVSEPRMNDIASMTNGQHTYIAAPDEGETTSLSGSERTARYRATIKRFVFTGGTGSDSDAADKVDFVAEALEQRARFHLDLAERMEGSDRNDLAKRSYTRIVREFPETVAAEQARTRLASLKAEAGE
jgi:hypothetical protein